jgi:hypothetical protein
MRALAVLGMMMCAGCAAGATDEGSLFPAEVAAPEAPEGTNGASAPADELAVASGVDEVQIGAIHTTNGHHWFELRVPDAADGVLELNVPPTIANATLTLFDDARRPIASASQRWMRAAVSRARTYYVDVEAADSREVNLVSSFRPVVDTFEPNDDPASAPEIEPGKPTAVRLFRAIDQNGGEDSDFFRVKTKGMKSVHFQLANGAGGMLCVSAFDNQRAVVGSTCSDGDIDTAFALSASANELVVMLTGQNGSEPSTMTITPQ